MEQVRHVLMATDTVGGVWNYSLSLAEALAQEGVRVSLATMGRKPSEAQLESARSISTLEVFPSDYKLEWMEEPWEDVDQAGKWLLELESELKPDVLHLNNYAFGALLTKAPKVVVCHSCVSSWWEAVKNETAPDDWCCYRKNVRRGLCGADMVVAPTHAMMNHVRTIYGFQGDGAVVYNAVDPLCFYEGQKEPFILAVGRIWDEGKNIQLLDSIAKNLPWPVYVAGEDKSPRKQSQVAERDSASSESPQRTANSSISPSPARSLDPARRGNERSKSGEVGEESSGIARSRMSGEGHDIGTNLGGGAANRERGTHGQESAGSESPKGHAINTKPLSSVREVGELANREEGAENERPRATQPGTVNFLGMVSPEELAGWYSRASIYCSPAKYEPFGVSILEAAHSGCSLVLGDIQTLREVWGAAAAYADPCDPMALEFCLQRQIENEHLRLEMANRAKEKAQEYSLERMGRDYMELYSSLVAQTARMQGAFLG